MYRMKVDSMSTGSEAFSNRHTKVARTIE